MSEREAQGRDATRLQVGQERTREGVRRDASALRLVHPGDIIRDERLDGDSYLLAPGDHRVGTLARAGVCIEGLAGARVTTTCTFNGDGVLISGVRFEGPDEAAALVTVGAAARVVFVGCRFRRGLRTGAAGSYVDVVAGGRAVFSGCVFDGAAVAGNVVDNTLGAIGDVQIIGCRRATALVHVNCTVIGEV